MFEVLTPDMQASYLTNLTQAGYEAFLKQAA